MMAIALIPHPTLSYVKNNVLLFFCLQLPYQAIDSTKPYYNLEGY